MIRWLNVTSSSNSEVGAYVPLNEHVIISIFFMILLVMFLATLFYMFYVGKKLDRYRLKYGFDRELELKDIKEKTEEKRNKRLDKIQKAFERRTFKD